MKPNLLAFHRPLLPFCGLVQGDDALVTRLGLIASCPRPAPQSSQGPDPNNAFGLPLHSRTVGNTASSIAGHRQGYGIGAP
jgi:hypothetical protein